MGHYFLDTQYPGWGDVAKNWRLKIQVWTNTYISISKSDHRHIINIRVGEHFLLCTSHQGYCCCCCNVQSALMAWPLVEELFLWLPLWNSCNLMRVDIWYIYLFTTFHGLRVKLDLIRLIFTIINYSMSMKSRPFLYSDSLYTVCSRSSDPFYYSNLLYEMGHYFLNTQ